MFSELLTRLTQPRPLPLPDTDARLALAALLVRVAKSDNNFAFEEVRQIDRILAQTFGLKPIEAAKLRATCEALERDAPGTPEFTRILREEVDYADRKALGEAMWQVALSDGARNEDEEIQLVAIETALGLSDEDMAAARANALNTL